MGIVFAVLAILALSIKGIGLLDRQSAPKVTGTEAIPGTAPAPTPVPDGKITGQQVAAIAVALALSEQKGSSITPAISKADSSAGSWLQSGRMRVLGSGSGGARERGN
jgi:Na+-transporting methylmalonyl-CoA/oxaloacetate decarboxylase gamma subunit